MCKALKQTVLEFLNVPSNPPDPPPGSAEGVKTFRASENYLLYCLITGLIGPLLLTLGGLVAFLICLAMGSIGLAVLFLVITVLLIPVCLFAYFAIRIEYDLRYYIVTDRALRIREGVWTLHEATFTFANVQNLSVKQGPIDSLLGIAHLTVHTAGGGGGGGGNMQGQQQSLYPQRNVLRGIDNARKVRDQIQALVKEYRDSGLGDERSSRTNTSSTDIEPSDISSNNRETLREIRDEVGRLRQMLEDRGPS